MMTDRKTWAELLLLVSAESAQSLTEGEELLAAFFQSSTVGVAVLDANLRYVAVNQALAAINGAAAQSHLGKNVREVIGEIGELIEQNLAQVLVMRQAVKFEVSGKLARGGKTVRWALDVFPVSRSDGSITRIGAIVLDLTASKELEDSPGQLEGQLQRETNRLQMLTDVISLISCNWDIAQVFPTISARLRRVLRQEFASFSLHDASTGLLVHQATDFPLGKGLMPPAQVNPNETPAGRSLLERKPVIFSKQQLQGLDGEVARGLLSEGLESLCCVPLLRPKGPLGVVVLGSTRPDAFRNDDVELIEKVAAQLAVAIENHRIAAEIEELKQRLGEERTYLLGETRAEGDFADIIGKSLPLGQALDQVSTVAASEATVLILGETGTGKELIAHAIHRMSRVKNGPFIKVNCAAIPTGLLESELFGHEKGAFTGAISRKIGRIELADGGTLFLDEVGEIPIELQPKLLRVLQDQEFERLGSTRTVKVKVRVVAATNRNCVLPAGAILFVEGQAPRGVFIICSGKVNLSTTSREGKLLILRTVGPGEALGLSAAVSGVTYETTAETATPCHVNFVDRKHFVELMQTHPEIGLQTAQCLSRDYQSAYRDIHDLVLTRSSAGKLARLLLSQVRAEEDLDAGDKPSPMTHEEMAMRIGASRETVTRLITRLRRKRLIRLDGPMLVIKDRTALEALAV